VNRLLKQFVQMRKMLKVVGGMSGNRAGRNPMAMRKQMSQLRSMFRG